MSYIDKILKEWSYRLSSGMPDKNNPSHIWELKHILLEWGWDTSAIEELIKSFQEVEKPKEIIKENITEGGESVWQTKAGNWRGERPDGTRRSFGEKDKTIRWVAGEEFEDTDDDSSTEDSDSKDLNQDIDFNNPPESIQKEIQPDDENFEKQDSINPHTYNPDTIEVNGEEIQLPITEEVLLEKVFKQPPYKFPKKYIKTLVRIMNTQQIDKDNPPITDFTKSDVDREKVGAGQISAQASELLVLMSTTLSDEEANTLYDILEKTSDATEGDNQILDKDWIGASRGMRNSTLKNIREKYGDDVEIEFGGWDSQADFEDGVGLDYDKKGFSTDTVFRVKVDGKSVIAEVSNKKDLTVHLGSPSAADTEKRMEEAGVDIPDSQKTSKYTKNAQVRSENRLNSTTQDDLDTLERMNNMNDDELLEYLSALPDEMRAMFTTGNKQKGLKLRPDARKYLELSKIPQPWDTSNPEFVEQARKVGLELGKTGLSQKGANKTAIFMNYLLYANELNNGIEDGPARDFIHNQVGIIGQEPFPEGSQRDVQNNFILNLGKKESREVVMETIRDKFPLKLLLEGDESMVLGSFRLSPAVCEKIFGTTNYEEIQEKLSVKKDKDGNYYLVYSAGTGEKDIQIAHLKARGKGIGYSNITFEMSMSEEFKHTTYCANMKDENPPSIDDLTDSETKEINKLVKKYGECE